MVAISALPSNTVGADADLTVTNQSGTTKTLTLARLWTYILSKITGNAATVRSGIGAAASGANTDITSLSVAALGNSGFGSFFVRGLNLNATGDTTVTITYPTGVSRFHIDAIRISHASTSLTTARLGIYTAASQGGFAIAAQQALSAVTQTADDTTGNSAGITVVAASTNAHAVATLYINVGTAQGSAATADITINLLWL